jgi:ubiquinone/menaquinone biosynthesis C-methylase UbiE
MPKTYLEKIESLESDCRRFILRAERKTLKKIYDENFSGEEMVLEIGCGTGSLKRNIPTHNEWVQLDKDKTLLRRAKEKNPKGDYILASAYNLPFVNGAFGAVVGFNSFDVLENVDVAIGETYRVLKPNGLFLHMLDVHPAETLIIRDLEKRGLEFYGEFPEDTEADSEKNIYFLTDEKKKKFDKEAEKIPEGSSINASIYALKRLVELYKKHGESIPLTKRVEYFEKILASELKPYFGEVEIGSVTCSHEGKRLEHQEGYGYASAFSGGVSLKIRKNIIQEKKSFQYLFYRLAKTISPKFAEKIEPSCIEVSTIRHVKVRKP